METGFKGFDVGAEVNKKPLSDFKKRSKFKNRYLSRNAMHGDFIQHDWDPKYKIQLQDL